MPITLNTPVVQSFPSSTVTGFQEINEIYTYGPPGNPGAGTVVVNFQYVGSNVDTGIHSCPAMAATTFEALTGATQRIKGMVAIIVYLGLAGGTYTVT